MLKMKHARYYSHPAASPWWCLFSICSADVEWKHRKSLSSPVRAYLLLFIVYVCVGLRLCVVCVYTCTCVSVRYHKEGSIIFDPRFVPRERDRQMEMSRSKFCCNFQLESISHFFPPLLQLLPVFSSLVAHGGKQSDILAKRVSSISIYI